MKANMCIASFLGGRFSNFVCKIEYSLLAVSLHRCMSISQVHFKEKMIEMFLHKCKSIHTQFMYNVYQAEVCSLFLQRLQCATIILMER